LIKYKNQRNWQTLVKDAHNTRVDAEEKTQHQQPSRTEEEKKPTR